MCLYDDYLLVLDTQDSATKKTLFDQALAENTIIMIVQGNGAKAVQLAAFAKEVVGDVGAWQRRAIHIKNLSDLSTLAAGYPKLTNIMTSSSTVVGFTMPFRQRKPLGKIVDSPSVIIDETAVEDSFTTAEEAQQ